MRAFFWTALAALAVLLASPASAADSNPDRNCSFAHKVSEVAALNDLPAAIRSYLTMPPLRIAGGTPLNRGDVISTDRPNPGMLRAGYIGGHWFVWMITNGVIGGQTAQLRLYGEESYGIIPISFDPRKIPPSGDLCARTDAALDVAFWGGNVSEECVFPPGMKEASLKDLPTLLRALLPSPIADKGEPFNSGDVVSSWLPNTGLIRAGHIGTHWFAYILHGGNIASNPQFLLYDESQSIVSGPKSQPVSRNDFCIWAKAQLDALP